MRTHSKCFHREIRKIAVQISHSPRGTLLAVNVDFIKDSWLLGKFDGI